MSERTLPIRPDLEQLRHQAKDLLRAIERGDPEALAELREHSPRTDPAAAKLADAQHVLARSYGAANWARLVHACELIDAIWRDDVDAVTQLVTAHPKLLHQPARIVEDNWGPPMTYAANLGRNRIIRVLHNLGARDTMWAMGRAVLQGKIDTARMLHELLGNHTPPAGALAGPAYTLSVDGTAFALSIGARVMGPHGPDAGIMEHLLGTDSRNPAAKHRILEMYEEHGFEPPNTPVMALHRGRMDLLQQHLDEDPTLLTRTFTLEEIFHLAPACHSTPYSAQGTPLDGTTLLHMAVYFDEFEIGEWLLDRGMNPDAPAAMNRDGIGGYTALFSTVVSQHNFWVNYGKGQPDDARFTTLLLDRGANPNARASLRHRPEEGHGGGPLRDYPDVTPLGWGDQFPMKVFVSRESVRRIEALGGGR